MQDVRTLFGDIPRRRVAIDEVLLYLIRKLGSWSLLAWDEHTIDLSLSFYTSIADLLMIEEVSDGEYEPSLLSNYARQF